MVSTTAPFTLQHIGTGTSRFPSGVALPTITDASVDPYIRTRPIKTVQVECIEFWPQEKGPYPGIVLLHEWWGLNSQIREVARRLSRQGYVAIVPDLYQGRVARDAESAHVLSRSLDEDRAVATLAAASSWLKTQPRTATGRVGVMGFCMGGGAR